MSDSDGEKNVSRGEVPVHCPHKGGDATVHVQVPNIWKPGTVFEGCTKLHPGEECDHACMETPAGEAGAARVAKEALDEHVQDLGTVGKNVIG